MADELISFPETEAVLKELADAVMAEYKRQLVKDGHFTYFGRDRLVDTITAEVDMGEHSFSASLKMNYYWQFLEEGIKPAGRYKNPGWKSFPFILKWVEIKPIIPKANNGKIPRPKSLAYLIVRKRNEVGMEGSHGFQKTRDSILPQYYERIKEALGRDIGNYLAAFFYR